MTETKRLTLRKWRESDAEALYEFAKDPDIGPSAGWQPHKDVAESVNVIKTILNGAECYAICEKGTDTPIGTIELKLKGRADVTDRDGECEMGFALSKKFWGRGYIPEAAEALLERAFGELSMTAVWCAYYDGNSKSKRAQEKIGFVYHHTNYKTPVPLLSEIRDCHVNLMTREQWESRRNSK